MALKIKFSVSNYWEAQRQGGHIQKEAAKVRTQTGKK
jgi:hypothetical protein